MRTVILLALAVSAAMGEVRTMTLRQAVDLALKQSPDVLLARIDELKAQHAIREARDPFFPKVVVGSGLAYSSGFPLSIEGSSPSIIRADAIQTLFNRERSLHVARTREEARGAGIDLQSRREQAVLNAATAFLETARLGRAAGVAAEQTRSLERMAETTRTRVEAGQELVIEIKKIEARLAQAKHRLFALEGDVTSQEESLAVLLGFAPPDRIHPAQDDQRIQAEVLTEEEAAERAIASNVTLKSLESKIQAAALDLKANQAARLPKVDLVAQYGLFARYNNYEDFFQKFQRNNGQIGVSFQFPLLAGTAASSRADQSAAEAARLRIQMNHTRNRVSLEARRAQRDLKTAASLRDAARIDLEAAREQVTVLVAQFEEGKIGLRQVEEARLSENDKWIAYLDAQTRLERLNLALLKETGGLLAAFTQ